MYSLSYQGGTGNDVTLTSIPAPQVVACSVAPGVILGPGSISIQVTFSKPMKVGNLDTSDFSLQGIFHGQIYSLNSFGFNADGTILTLLLTAMLYVLSRDPTGRAPGSLVLLTGLFMLSLWAKLTTPATFHLGAHPLGRRATLTASTSAK